MSMYWNFIELLKPVFETEGFEFVKGLSAFRRKIGICEYRFRTYNLSGLEVGIDYGIRFKVIEEILSKVFQIKPNTYLNTIFIGGISYLGIEETNFFVTTKGEQKDALTKTKELFWEHAMPYFERYNTLQSLDRLINGIPIEENKRRNDKFHGSTMEMVLKGMVVAKLIDKPDFPALEKYYMDFMKTRSENLAPRLQEKSVREFKAYLERLHEIDFKIYRKRIASSP